MKRKLHISISVFVLSIMLIRTTVNAQFTITENFKNSTANNNIVLGGTPSAYLTSGKDDPQGNGWLRVTKATNNQKGFAYIDQTFPSTLGVFVDFEFKAWRTKSDNGYNGADGFSVFLFNADSSGSHFHLGGNGGSLGYAPNTSTPPVTSSGLSGGYIGIGLDEYGNFSVKTEGRNGGYTTLKPNSVVLRGPTTKDPTTTNKYLGGYQFNTSDTSNQGIDYNETVKVDSTWHRSTRHHRNGYYTYDTTWAYPQSRPDDNTYYRRVQISVVPDNGKYDITVKMAKTPGGAFTQYITYTTTDAPPANLKIGFAASTGSGFNYHDVRNLYVTTPGGVRVDKSVDKSSATVGSHLVYTINAYNATAAALTGLALKDTLYDGSDNIAGQDAIRLDSVKFNNHGNSGNTYSDISFDPAKSIVGANLNMGASTTTDGDAQATFTVYATVLKAPAGGSYINKVFLGTGTSGITDDDMTNNYASASTTIISNDLSITATHDGDFHAGDQNKNITVQVKNNGPDATGTTTTVTDTLPAGFIYAGTTGDQGNGWIISVSDNIVTAIYNGSVSSGGNFPDLAIPVNIAPSATGQTLTNKVNVQNDADNNPTNNNATDDISIENPIGLPVTLSAFTGNRVKNANVLQWTTASEINNKGFELERSVDNGATWQNVVFVTGHGNSTISNDYSYTDVEGATYATAMYRLEQTDMDGKTTLENKVVIISGTALNVLNVYPNPAHGEITIGGLHTGDNVTIYSTDGHAVKRFTATVVSQQIDISSLPTGIYYIKVSGTASNSTGTFIVK